MALHPTRLATVSSHGSDLVRAHQPRDAMLAARLSGFTQVEEHSRRTINAITGIERRADKLQKPCIFACSVTLGLLHPGVVAAGRDLEYPAHHSYVILVAM
jgi:hypothetical protein